MVKTGLVKIQCLTCGIETNHKKLWSKIILWNIKEEQIYGEDTYEVYSCKGCEEVSFRKVTKNSEDFYIIGNTEKGNPIIEPTISITYYPMRNRRMIKEKSDSWYAPQRVRRTYGETIAAYNNELLTLCAIGIRATIEAICLGENIEGPDLKRKIVELVRRRIVTPKIGKGLQESRLLGNESAHQLEIFGDTELLAAIQLIESVIEGHYTSDKKIKEIKARRAHD